MKGVKSSSGDARKKPLALILEPSKELAEQTMNQVRLFKKNLPTPGISETLLIGRFPLLLTADET